MRAGPKKTAVKSGCVNTTALDAGVLQAAHLWEFRAGGTGWGPSDPDAGFGDGPLDARKATLLRVLNDVGGKTIKYLYDNFLNPNHSMMSRLQNSGVESGCVGTSAFNGGFLGPARIFRRFPAHLSLPALPCASCTG